MIISCIIPTYKREDLLREAVLSVLRQEPCGAEVEVVVVNDAGEPLSKADWQRDDRVRVYDTRHTERSVARNTGAALSKGDYLHFLDDDDVLLEDGYDALVTAVFREPEADLVVGAYEALMGDIEKPIRIKPIVDNRLFARLVVGIGIPLGCCLVKRDTFFRVGGFDATFDVMEDLELLQRIVLEGCVISVDSVVARFRMGQHAFSTTDWKASSDACRKQREKAFGLPGVVRALRRSLRHPEAAYIRGRLVRFCFGSAARHLQRGLASTACQRLSMGIVLAASGFANADFWRGLGCFHKARSDLGEIIERA